MERDPSGFLALELSHALRTGTVAIEASVAFLISDPVEIINAFFPVSELRFSAQADAAF